MSQHDVPKALAIVREHFEEIDATLTPFPALQVQAATGEVLQRLINRPAVGQRLLPSTEAAHLLGASPDS
ncbi:MAG: hypothetical protein M1318_00390 [Firmicutes bacterium]|nr:hypothetical protein [Bacillota bacterium]